LLDKPGVSAYPEYKEISFFEQAVGSALSRSALFSRRGSTLTYRVLSFVPQVYKCRNAQFLKIRSLMLRLSIYSAG